MANDRVAQSVTEAIVLGDNSFARSGQSVVEVVIRPDNAIAREAQAVTEAIVLPTSAQARVTYYAMEVGHQGSSSARVSQSLLEIANQATSQARVSQSLLEVAYPVELPTLGSRFHVVWIPDPSNNEASVVIPPPAPPPPPYVGTSRTVSSISDLLTTLADTNIGEIVLTNGTYSTSWMSIDGTATPGYARTSASRVIVRAETDGGVTLNFGGSAIAQWFRGGAAYQEWRGFKYGNVLPSDNGVIALGEGNGVPIHHITFRNIEFLNTIVEQTVQNGQGIYFSWANGEGNHDILVDGFVSNAQLWAAIHVYHDDLGHLGHHNTVRNMTVGPNHASAIVVWSSTLHDYLFEDCTINGADEYGVIHAEGGVSNTITLRRITTTNSTLGGFYSYEGTYPNVPGITFESCSFG